jgi:drug/metabolite transporter (DMT)-like permease
MNIKAAYFALAIVSVVWGTTYLAMRIGVETFPPLLFAGIRHTVAGLILFATLKLTGRWIPLNFKETRNHVIAGILMLTLANGVIGWAERYIPSGLAALIVSSMPIYVVGVNYFSGIDRRVLNLKITAGLLLGLAGVVLIFKDNLKDLGDSRYFFGVIATFLSSLCWAMGSIFSKHRPTRANSFVNATAQLIGGGIALLLIAPIFDDLSELNHVTSSSIGALAYLILFGSLLSFICYLYALEKLPVGLVSVYAYINPFIALALGALVLNEKVTWITALALVLTLMGVYFINAGYAKRKAASLTIDTKGESCES